MRLASLLLLTFAMLSSGVAWAATTGTVSGTVTDSDGRPIAGASVRLQGPGGPHTITDAHGAFILTNVAPGEYTVVVTKTGFAQSTQILDVFIGETEQLHLTLVASSFSSLRTIAHVSTNRPGYVPIN